MLAAGDNCLMAAVGRGDGAEAGQAIREHMGAGLQMPLGPGCDGLSAEATHSCDPGVNRMTRLVQGDGRDNGAKARPDPFRREISPVWSAFLPCSARNHQNPAACRPSLQSWPAIRGLFSRELDWFSRFSLDIATHKELEACHLKC
jgi:hypothetical protein